MHFFELSIGDVSIDLSGSDGRMAEHRLNAPDIGAVSEQISCETMAQSMRMNFFY